MAFPDPMARNAVKEAAASRTMIRGVHLTYAAPPVIEVLARLRLDFVYLDGEHGAFTPHDLEACCVAAERHGMVPIARVPERSESAISHFLDRGVRGIVVPHVSSVTEAQEVLDATYFQPLGHRSFGAGRPYFHAIDDLPAHFARCNATVSVGIMIETTGALAAAEEIAALEGVDYLSFGMNDFSQELGHAGRLDHPEVQRARHDGAARIRRAGKPVREDFMRFAWISEIILAGGEQLLGAPPEKDGA
jgi:2-keto-3-deoxy-L-rhamnonate aldolase RhmA